MKENLMCIIFLGAIIITTIVICMFVRWCIEKNRENKK